jgi:hypothetical protein
MPGLGRILSRTFFWSYERGTWQYDVAVVLILVFVLLTPRRWFHDQPMMGIPASPGEVLLIAVSNAGHQQTYRVDARILAPPAQTPTLQNDLHNALQKSLSDLRNGRFSIGSIQAVRDDQGNVIAYDVEIRR